MFTLKLSSIAWADDKLLRNGPILFEMAKFMNLLHFLILGFDLAVENGTEEGQSWSQTGRRTHLPAPQPDTSQLSLWNILKKNIGKDLSKISMPVALNEPLSMLQVSDL